MRCAIILPARDPGVAKFGIALEWGSRGRWFESSHSDQKRKRGVSPSSFFGLNAKSNQRPLISISPHGRPGEAVGRPLVRIQSLGPKRKRGISPSSFFVCASREPAASCISISPHGRPGGAVGRPLFRIQLLAPKQEERQKPLLLFCYKRTMICFFRSRSHEAASHQRQRPFCRLHPSEV